MSDTRRVEVIVAGAGPAGLHAAIAAAKLGVSVLVFDKKTTIGTPVKCGELLPSKEELLDFLPGCRDFEYLFEIPSYAISNECAKIRMYSPHGKCWEFPFGAHVLDRVRFEQLLAEEAKRLGVQFRLGCSVRFFERDGKLKVGPSQVNSLEADVLIAADGFPSIAFSSKELSVDQYGVPKNIAINYQYLMDNLSIDSDVTEMYTGTDLAPGGYAWIIPKNDATANVGVGIRTPFTRSRKGKCHLDYFVHGCPLTAHKLQSGTVRTMITDVLPIDGAISKTYSNRVLCVGDSAGMVMPTNGGGIPTAIVSGHIAGEVAACHVQKGARLSEYEARWRNAFGRELHASRRMRRFADVFMPHDTLFDWAMRLLGTGGIKRVITCKIPGGLDILMRLFGY